MESIKCEVARLIYLLEQVLSIKNGKGMHMQPSVGTLFDHIPHEKNIFSSSSQHSTSNDHIVEAAPLLFSHEN